MAEMADAAIAVVEVTNLNRAAEEAIKTHPSHVLRSMPHRAARRGLRRLEILRMRGARLPESSKNNLGPRSRVCVRMAAAGGLGGHFSSNIIFLETEQVSKSIDEALTASENRGGDGSQTTARSVASPTEVLADRAG